MTRLGIFGGTFDPPHIGHLILAAEAQVQLRLNRVLWVLTPKPPHKTDQSISSLDDRMEMLRAAVVEDPLFEISSVDIDRPPPHFAVDTVRLLHHLYPMDKLIYLMGSDSLKDLADWHQPREFILQCDELGVMSRPDTPFDLLELENRLPGLSERVRFLEAPLLEISSTRLRDKIAHDAAYRYYLPSGVCRLVEQRNLYHRESKLI
jgi:nicotinate-nucleotide adenylyltransferase